MWADFSGNNSDRTGEMYAVQARRLLSQELVTFFPEVIRLVAIACQTLLRLSKSPKNIALTGVRDCRNSCCIDARIFRFAD